MNHNPNNHNENNLLELLNYIDPVSCNYSEWVQVGMALKEEGYTPDAWEAWSARDSRRYHRGECRRKWGSFSGRDIPVTGGTIYQMALDRGWKPATSVGPGYDWDDEIEYTEQIVKQEWLEPLEIQEPPNKDWHPAEELIKYLEILFEPGENVGYVVQSYLSDKGKYLPGNKGCLDRTAGELIEQLSRCKDDIGKVLGDYNTDAGAWIRFNPLDGKGVRNENVSEYRYALVESDEMDLDRQNAIIREIELPVAVLMFSGAKSLHAIVRIDAPDYQEYQRRVNYLYSVCEKNGLKIDTQNRNPSRLSRMPGATRAGRKQFIIDTNIGKASYDEWRDWIEGANDDLPDVEELGDVWDNMPQLSPCLIDDVLREGHKMLIAGPSKAGKTFLQIELCIAIAEGTDWLGWQCAQGRVMYINLELDRASCLNRFKEVYDALGIRPRNLRNIDIWNLRGKSAPMDKLAPKIIRRAQKKNYAAVIIDPIYKVITGDENSADQMAKFCNQFDKICAELNCAVIYCHHHSKGAQGGKKSMDRASGSGVFARDPDTLLDMIELPLTDDIRKQEENKAVCEACIDFMDAHEIGYREDLSQDDLLNARVTLEYARNSCGRRLLPVLEKRVEDAKRAVSGLTAWRIDATLREFPRFEPVNLWFDYPVHRADDSGVLSDIDPEDEKPFYQKMVEKGKENAKKRRAEILDSVRIAYEGLEQDGKASAINIAEQIGVTPQMVKKWFGNGNRSRKEYKKEFETYVDETDKRLYLRKKENADT